MTRKAILMVLAVLGLLAWLWFANEPKSTPYVSPVQMADDVFVEGEMERLDSLQADSLTLFNSVEK